jgi:hypothetical protein
MILLTPDLRERLLANSRKRNVDHEMCQRAGRFWAQVTSCVAGRVRKS